MGVYKIGGFTLISLATTGQEVGGHGRVCEDRRVPEGAERGGGAVATRGRPPLQGSNPYLSQVETGQRGPELRILRLLAPVYEATLRDLMERAGHLQEAELVVDEEAELERAFQYVLADPRFRFGTWPQGELGLEAKRFFVEMYERLTGRRLL